MPPIMLDGVPGTGVRSFPDDDIADVHAVHEMGPIRGTWIAPTWEHPQRRLSLDYDHGREWLVDVGQRGKGLEPPP